MKVNLPVSQKAVLLAEDALIASRTDLKGKITSVNQEFIDVSGFKEDELIGKSHNIIRHPDMPSEAYQSLWQTVKSGQPWTGIVKNRCKNGDHYWVEANVTPYKENGVVMGYISIRRKATEQQIQQATRKYQAMKDEIKPSLLKTVKNKLQSVLSIKHMFVGLISSLALIFLSMMGVALYFVPNATLTSNVAASMTTTIIISLALVGIVLLLLSYLLLSKHLVTPLKTLQAKLLNLALTGQGNSLTSEYSFSEINQVRRAYNALEVRTAFNQIETQNNIELIQSALDSATLPITLGGNENKLVYINRAARAM